ncbi:MAG: SDR family NAD(P)-dependent oxidoreductase [Gammaproteobacteria bacterium]|nr:SDR family NAD(P)-dependent oxidoreductase [Gammaproteobacteria bacterium]
MNILITGASSGIGKQLTLDYIAAGHNVYACGRNQEKLAALQSELPPAQQGRFHAVVFDVTEREQVQSALSKLEQLDLAILNAGVCEYIDDAKSFDAALVERVFAANFFGVVYCCETLVRHMQSGARIAIVDSMARLFPFTRAEAYGASKAAVHYFASSLRADLKDYGIAVTTISPGFVETPMTDANDFEMPMRISVAKASIAIQKGLAGGKPHIAFPRIFGWMLAFLHRLPYRWQIALSTRMRS